MRKLNVLLSAVRDENTIIISCRRQQEENTWNKISENGKHFPPFFCGCVGVAFWFCENVSIHILAMSR